MKSKTLASIGAVLLYVYCEFFQASPFAPAGPDVTERDSTITTEMTTDGESGDQLRALFAQGRPAK